MPSVGEWCVSADDHPPRQPPQSDWEQVMKLEGSVRERALSTQEMRDVLQQLKYDTLTAMKQEIRSCVEEVVKQELQLGKPTPVQQQSKQGSMQTQLVFAVDQHRTLENRALEEVEASSDIGGSAGHQDEFSENDLHTKNRDLISRLERVELMLLDTTRLVAEAKDLKASQNAQKVEIEEDSSGALTALPKVAVPWDDPRSGPDTERCDVKLEHFVSWRETRPQQNVDLVYEFHDSVWDMLVLVGINIMQPADELIVIIAGICNIIIQVSFIVLVKVSLIGDDRSPSHEDYADQMLTWRVTYAHDPKYANALENKPLAQMVCDRQTTNMEGIHQANTYMDVHDYLKRAFGIQSGESLCMLAILLWLLTCFKECLQAMSMCHGAWCVVHRSGKTGLKGCSRLLSAESGISIEAATHADDAHNPKTRKSFILRNSLVRGCVVTGIIVLPRLAILSALGSVGVQYLVNTIQLEELILNAVALDVVLHVDEMLFDIFVSSSAKIILAKTYAMPRTNWGPTMASVQAYMKVGALVSILVVIRIAMLGPVINNLKEVDHVMCGGDTEFLAAETSIGIVFAGAPTKELQFNTDGYKYSAILQKTKLSPEADGLGPAKFYLDSDSPQVVYPIPDVKQAIWHADLSIEETLQLPVLGSEQVAFGVQCVTDYAWDYLIRQHDPNQTVKKTILQFMDKEFASLNKPNCTMLFDVGYCFQSSKLGNIARSFCPVSCLLADPTSGNAFNDQANGVPRHCYVWHEYYLRAASHRQHDHHQTGIPFQCADVPASSKKWSYYADSMLNYMKHFLTISEGPAHVDNVTAKLRNLYVTQGCDMLNDPESYLTFVTPTGRVQSRLRDFFCDPNQLMNNDFKVRSLRYLCPETCGCVDDVREAYRIDGKMWTPEISLETQCPRACFNYTVYFLKRVHGRVRVFSGR